MSFAKKFSWVCFLLSFALLAISCNKTKDLPGTGGTVVKSEKTGALVYPHDAEFFKSHGTQYVQSKSQCISCHGADGSGGNTKVSCKQCHQNFPHPADWKNKELHANAFHKAPSSCALCHGDDWKGGKTPSSCQQCHSSYPHPKEWSLPTNHGKAFVETETKANCFGCHDTKKLEKTATDCTACHVGFPHMKGHKLPSMTYDGKCLICHRNYTENMPKYGPKGGCLKCHDGTLEIHWREEPEPIPNQVPADPPPPAPLDHAKVASPSKRKPSSAVKMKKTPAAPQQ